MALKLYIEGSNAAQPIEIDDFAFIYDVLDEFNPKISISTDKLTFTGDNARFLLNYIENAANGSEGVFYGIPCEFKINQISLFD